MDVTGAGTAIMLAIAAVLWFAYFVPTWMARREYLDTERTATRLQQTLRIMAETAEVPEPVRVEVSAREAARQEKVLRARQAAVDAAAAREAARARAVGVDHARLRRRRAHGLATLLLLSATITLGVQLWLIATAGAVMGSWLVLAAGVGLGIASANVRRRAGRVRASGDVMRPREAPPVRAEPAVTAPRGRASTWTPVPVPPPLYLSRPETQSLRPSPDVAAQLRLAAQAAEQALREAHQQPEVVPFRPQAAPNQPSQPSREPSRWAAMGRLDASGGGAVAPDLDEVLRRRRAAG